MIILFKRAEVGGYEENRLDLSDCAPDSTLKIIKDNSEYSNKNVERQRLLSAVDRVSGLTYNSDLNRPKAINNYTKAYYWFIFKFESEFSYLLLSVFVILIPVGVFLYCCIDDAMSRLPVITYSHCVKRQLKTYNNEFEISSNMFLGTLYDIIVRCID